MENPEVSLADRPTVTRQSPLYLWMAKNWPELEKGEISWPWLMGKIAAAGLTDASGKPLTLRTARNTLYKVRRSIKRTSRRWEPLAASAPLPITLPEARADPRFKIARIKD